MTAVLAVDPGLTTGWATWHYGEPGYFTQTEGQMEFLDQAVQILDIYQPEVVCEAYIITGETAKKSRQYEPLEIIGALRWECHRRGLPFKLQTPAQAKGFATDDKLKALGWYNASKGGHSNDAARHLLTYMVTQRKDEELLNKLLEVLG